MNRRHFVRLAVPLPPQPSRSAHRSRRRLSHPRHHHRQSVSARRRQRSGHAPAGGETRTDLKQPIVIETKAGAPARSARSSSPAQGPTATRCCPISSRYPGSRKSTGYTGVRRSSPMRISFHSPGTSPIHACSSERSAALQDAEGIGRRRQEAAQRNGIQLIGPLRRAPHADRTVHQRRRGQKMRHLPTQGGGPAVTALLGNMPRCWLVGIGLPVAGQGWQGRPLAVFGAQRSPALPDVPTLEGGRLRHRVHLWVGPFAPKGTPANVTTYLHEGLGKAANSEPFKTALANLGQEPALHRAGVICWAADPQRIESSHPLDRQGRGLKPERATNCANHLAASRVPSPLTTPSPRCAEGRERTALDHPHRSRRRQRLRGARDRRARAQWRSAGGDAVDSGAA